jgi:hypothetical protein
MLRPCRNPILLLDSLPTKVRDDLELVARKMEVTLPDGQSNTLYIDDVIMECIKLCAHMVRHIDNLPFGG